MLEWRAFAPWLPPLRAAAFFTDCGDVADGGFDEAGWHTDSGDCDPYGDVFWTSGAPWAGRPGLVACFAGGRPALLTLWPAAPRAHVVPVDRAWRQQAAADAAGALWRSAAADADSSGDEWGAAAEAAAC